MRLVPHDAKRVTVHRSESGRVELPWWHIDRVGCGDWLILDNVTHQAVASAMAYRARKQGKKFAMQTHEGDGVAIMRKNDYIPPPPRVPQPRVKAGRIVISKFARKYWARNDFGKIKIPWDKIYALDVGRGLILLGITGHTIQGRIHQPGNPSRKQFSRRTLPDGVYIHRVT